jgi:hypothetical protein
MGAPDDATAAPAAASRLDLVFENALTQRNQLLLDTLRLGRRRKAGA